MSGPSDSSNRNRDGGGIAVLEPPREAAERDVRREERPDRPGKATAPEDDRRERRVDPWATTVERPAAPEPRRQTAQSLRLLLAAALSTACLVVTAMNLTGSGPFRTGRLGASIEAAQTQVERDLAFAVEEIEAWRHEHGTLPSDLTPFDFGGERGWTYERTDPTSFRLTLEADSMRVSWDSRRAEERDGMDAAR